MNEVQPIIEKHCQNLSAQEANILLTNFRNYLKIDIVRDIEKVSESTGGFDFTSPVTSNASPFDDLINSYLEK